MKNQLLALVVCGLLAGVLGCGPNVGYVVKPIPIEEKLVETVVSSDKGLFVSDKVAIVDVDGIILNARSGLMGLSENPVSLFVEKLDRIQADNDVRAVVLRINSPGGGVTASDIMYHRLLEFKKARKVPVIAIIEDIGASGGYYLANGADRIIVHPTSVTGSIGVIVQTVSFAGTMRMIGIDAKAITSGRYKDMASPFKPLDPNDAAILQGLVNDFYKRFVDVVAAGRKGLNREQVVALADGRVYTADQALANGLADEIGYMDKAIAVAKTEGHIQKGKVVIYSRPWGYKSNEYAEAAAQTPGASQVNLINISAPELMRLGQPSFLYLWTGGEGEK